MLDCSEERESMSIKLRSCRETLDQLGVDPKKILVVLNKIDRLEGAALRNLEEDDLFAGLDVMKISAVKGDGLRQLKNRIIAATYPPNQEKAGGAQAASPPRFQSS
jgi:50S ribosomal subunit-associated GTPase HflX